MVSKNNKRTILATLKGNPTCDNFSKPPWIRNHYQSLEKSTIIENGTKVILCTILYPNPQKRTETLLSLAILTLATLALAILALVTLMDRYNFILSHSVQSYTLKYFFRYIKSTMGHHITFLSWDELSTLCRPSDKVSTLCRPSNKKVSTLCRPSDQVSTLCRPSDQVSTLCRPSDQVSTLCRPSDKKVSTLCRSSDEESAFKPGSPSNRVVF